MKLEDIKAQRINFTSIEVTGNLYFVGKSKNARLKVASFRTV